MKHPQNDKLLHFFYGSLITLGCMFLLPTWFALLCTLFVAIAKELYDSHIKLNGRFDWVDITYTIFTAVVLTIQSFF